MRDREREARRSAEEELAELRKRNDEKLSGLMELCKEVPRQNSVEREPTFRMLVDMFRELRNELREERRQHAAATQRALLDTIVRLTEQRDGRREDSPET